MNLSLFSFLTYLFSVLWHSEMMDIKEEDVESNGRGNGNMAQVIEYLPSIQHKVLVQTLVLSKKQ
jgi:hypothetical protein